MKSGEKTRPPAFSFDCPFCSAHVEGSLAEDDPSGGPWVVHILPMCGTFDRLDAAEYIEACGDVVRSVMIIPNQALLNMIDDWAADNIEGWFEDGDFSEADTADINEAADRLIPLLVSIEGEDIDPGARLEKWLKCGAMFKGFHGCAPESGNDDPEFSSTEDAKTPKN